MEFSSNIGVIGGSGFYSLEVGATLQKSQEPQDVHTISTPYADLPVTLFKENVAGSDIWFIPRHGKDHSVPPHKINYRANIWALKELGVNKIVAVNAVGGISEKMSSGTIVIPDQIIDYTYGREHTFFDGLRALENHIDFTWPYSKPLSECLIQSAVKASIKTLEAGVYACTQGPRLETAAEILKLAKEGNDIVGMTGMPEASLARELEMDYSCIALVVNWGAGLTDKAISMDDIQLIFDSGLDEIRKIIKIALPELI